MSTNSVLVFLDKKSYLTIENILIAIRDIVRKSVSIEFEFEVGSERTGLYLGNLYRMRKEQIFLDGKEIPVGLNESVTVFFNNPNGMFCGGYIKTDFNTAYIFMDESGVIAAAILFKTGLVNK